MKKISTLLFPLLLLSICTNAQLVVFAEDYAAGVSFAPFGGSTNNLSIDGTTAHTGSKSLKVDVTTNYTGGALVASTPANLSTYNVLTFWAKVSSLAVGSAAQLDASGFGNNAVTDTFTMERNGADLSTTWTKYYVPIPDPSKLTSATGLFFFAEGAGGVYTIWFDDIQFESISPASITGPSAAQFGDATFNVEVGVSFSANLDACRSTYTVLGQPLANLKTGKPYFTWTSANPAVASINSLGIGSGVASGSTTITAKLGALNATGTLTVNVSAPLPSPTVAAPNPQKAAYSVKSLFSGVYDNSNVSSWATDWSGCCRDYTELQVAGNDIKKYGLRHYTGIQFDNIDATNLDTLHMDVWTPTPTSPFTVRLVNFAAATTEGEITTTNLAGQQWVSLELPLNQFKFRGNGDVMGKGNLQQMLLLVPDQTSGTFYVDNIYFYKAGASLPVNLSDFNVTRRGNTSILNWKTLSEVNSKGFSVERSNNGNNWAELEFVNSKQNPSTTQLYSSTDRTPAKGSNYYRLKQVDRDGKFTYSKVVNLRFADTKLSAFSIYPNPAKNNLTVQLQALSSRSASLQLMNVEGKMVRNIILSDRNSDSNISIDISSLTKGVYYLTLKDGPVVQTTKVIVN